MKSRRASRFGDARGSEAGWESPLCSEGKARLVSIATRSPGARAAPPGARPSSGGNVRRSIRGQERAGFGRRHAWKGGLLAWLASASCLVLLSQAGSTGNADSEGHTDAMDAVDAGLSGIQGGLMAGLAVRRPSEKRSSLRVLMVTRTF